MGNGKCSTNTAGGILGRIFRIGLSLLGWIVNPVGKLIRAAIEIVAGIIGDLINRFAK